MRTERLNRLLRIAGSIVAFALLLYVLSRQGWEEILASLRGIPPWRLWAALGLMLVSRLAVSARWHTLLHSAGVPVRLQDSLRITFAGLFASNFLPTTIGGDVVRLAMAIRQGYDKVVAAASLVVDRLVGMAGMGTAAPLGLLPVLDRGEASALLALATMSLPARLGARVKRIWSRLWEAFGLWLRSPRGLLLAYFWTWIHQFCIFGVVWLMLGGLHEPIPYWLAGGLWSFTYFVTLLPISINGLGLQELSMTAIFSGLGGVSLAGAATAALLVRTLQMLASLPGAAFLPDILGGSRSAEGQVQP